MGRCWILGAMGLVTLVGCDDSLPPEPERTCATDIDVGEVQAFGDETPSRTEGVAFTDDGMLYVSALNADADDQLLRISLDGTSETVAESPSILGLESSGDSILAAAIQTGELLVIDPDTGELEVIRYSVVDDVGTVINPITLAGQIKGGIVQGLGQFGPHVCRKSNSSALSIGSTWSSSM